MSETQQEYDKIISKAADYLEKVMEELGLNDKYGAKGADILDSDEWEQVAFQLAEKASRKNDVFVVVETWNLSGDTDGSPAVTVFTTFELAQKRLRELIKIEKDTGAVGQEYDPEEEKDWEFIEEDDHFHAKNSERGIEVDFVIVPADVIEE